MAVQVSLLLQGAKRLGAQPLLPATDYYSLLPEFLCYNFITVTLFPALSLTISLSGHSAVLILVPQTHSFTAPFSPQV